MWLKIFCNSRLQGSQHLLLTFLGTYSQVHIHQHRHTHRKRKRERFIKTQQYVALWHSHPDTQWLGLCLCMLTQQTKMNHRQPFLSPLLYVNCIPLLLRLIAEASETAPSLKCLAHKHSDLNWTPRTHISQVWRYVLAMPLLGARDVKIPGAHCPASVANPPALG